MSQFLGKLLVASPMLDETSFARSVIYVFQDNEDATVGGILNRPVGEQEKRAWDHLVGQGCNHGLISNGGPIPGPLIAIHQDHNAREVELPNGVFTAASEQNIQYLAHQEDINFHVFFGLSGWQKGQLEAEVTEGAWITMPVVEELLFRQSVDLWSDAIGCFEKRFISDVLEIRSGPSNVLDN